MMLGQSYYGVAAEDENDRFLSRAVFEYCTSVIPRRCYNTRRWIWGRSMRGRRIITGPGEPIVEDRWYHKNEALIMLIKRSADGIV